MLVYDDVSDFVILTGYDFWEKIRDMIDWKVKRMQRYGNWLAVIDIDVYNVDNCELPFVPTKITIGLAVSITLKILNQSKYALGLWNYD